MISPFQFRLRRGVERFIYNLSNQLVRDYGVEIILYVWDMDSKVDWGNWHEKIIIRKVPYFRYYQKFIAQLLYKFWIKLDKPEHILINFLYHGELVLPRKSNIYYVLHSPSSLIKQRYMFIKKKKNNFDNLCFVAVSNNVKEKATPFISPNKISLIHHGIQINKFIKKTSYKKHQKLTLITIAALEKWKGIQDIISIMTDESINKHFTYDVYGSGPYENDLKKMVTKHNLNSSIRIMGSIDKVEKVLPNYDIYCQLSDGEAFGLSIIEAMACGLPVMLYDIPPFNMLFPSDKVVKVDRNVEGDLKNKLLGLLLLDKRENIGLRGQEFVTENFTVQKMAKEYIELFNN